MTARPEDAGPKHACPTGAGPNPDISVGIIGADAAALTLALACRSMGLHCHIYETGPDVPAIDPVLELTANATRVLHSLGLREALDTRVLEPMYSLIRTGRGGLLLNQRPLGPFSAARYGATCHLAPRSQLISILRNACEAEGADFHPAAASISSIDDETGTLQFANGSFREHDIIAQAVSLHPPGHADIPTDLQDSPPPQTNPQPAAGADFTVLRANSTRPGNPKAVQIWCASGICAIEYPHETGCQVLTVIAGAEDHSNPRALLQDRLAVLHPQLQKLADGLLDVSRIEGGNTDPLPHWYHNRRVLLGEACHPLPAHATQATAAGIEDAWVLATMLERWESTPSKGFPDYQQFRRPRVVKIRDHSLQQAEELTLSNARDIWIRNFRLSMTSRFLPEISMAKDDWLFGYDCIKGFV